MPLFPRRLSYVRPIAYFPNISNTYLDSKIDFIWNLVIELFVKGIWDKRIVAKTSASIFLVWYASVMPLMLLFRSYFAYRAYRGHIQIIRCLPRQKCKCRLTTSNIDLRIVLIRNNHCHQPKNARPPPSIPITMSDESEWTTYISREETKCLRIENFCYHQISIDTSKNTIQWRCSHRGCYASAKSTVDLKHLSL